VRTRVGASVDLDGRLLDWIPCEIMSEVSPILTGADVIMCPMTIFMLIRLTMRLATLKSRCVQTMTTLFALVRMTPCVYQSTVRLASKPDCLLRAARVSLRLSLS
jgi:hypothetical protein